ncbi:MAG: hypothetical protein ACP5QR_06995 [Rhizomicrobium sp.]
MTQPDRLTVTGQSPSQQRQELLIGVGQVVVLALVLGAAQGGGVPWAAAPLVSGCVLAVFLAPLLLVEGYGDIPKLALGLWCGLASVLLAAMGAWDRLRLYQPPASSGVAPSVWALLPSRGVVAAAIVIVASGQVMVAAWSGKDGIRTPYRGYFARARRLCRKLILSAGFVVSLWVILKIASGLCGLLALPAAARLIEQPVVCVPLSAVGALLGLILGRSRGAAIAERDNGLLFQLAWLLPVASLVALAFLFGATFAGFDLAWRHAGASALMLALAAGLIVLTNALWQDGAQAPGPLLRHTGTLAAFLVLPLVGLAAYALMVRIEAFGLSVRRVVGSGALAVFVVFALGYVVAGWQSLRGRSWLAGLGRANIAGTLALCGVLVLLYSPLADPARLAVASQMMRLQSGRTDAQQFDFSYLAREGAGFGQRALEALAKDSKGPQAELIRSRARQALLALSAQKPSLSARTRAAQLQIHPKGYGLPAGLASQAWTPAQGVPPCLVEEGQRCEIFPAELKGHPPDQMIVVWGGPLVWQTAVLGVGSSSRWQVIGTFGGLCQGTITALRAGLYAVVAPVITYRTLEVNGLDLNVEPVAARPPSCTPKARRSPNPGPSRRPQG